MTKINHNERAINGYCVSVSMLLNGKGKTVRII